MSIKEMQLGSMDGPSDESRALNRQKKRAAAKRQRQARKIQRKAKR